jgi:NIPSNAP protein
MPHATSPTRRDMLKLASGAASLAALGASPARAAAPMLGAVRPSIYRFKLGSFEITNILDGYVQGNGPHPIFGNNQPAETVQAFAKSQGLPPTRMENIFVNTLVNTGKELVLFDAGVWATEAGQPNEVCHLWAYSDLNARAAARAASAKDPGWQEFLKSSTGLLDEMHSTIMLPAAHSPLK